MAHDDINQITRELEDLLMMGKKNTSDRREELNKENFPEESGKFERTEDFEGVSESGRIQNAWEIKEPEDLQEDADSRESADSQEFLESKESVNSQEYTDSQDYVNNQEYTDSQDYADSQEYTDSQESADSQDYTDSEEFEDTQQYEDTMYFKRDRHSLSLIRPGDCRIAAFFVPVLIMLVIFVQRGIYPFGEQSFLRTDLYHQYAPFFSEFRHKLATGESLLYTWNIGMGVNFSALYAYYLASPLNWLLVLCPAGLVIEFITGMIVLKIGLSGLSMAYYLQKHCESSNFGIVFFAVFYALSGYMAAYSWNIMWLDCIVLFPLIMLGLERLVRSGKGLLYCVTLGISILSNYYISIMTCIFMILYFIALLVMEREMTWEKLLSRFFGFGLYSLLAGGLAALVLLPEIHALMMTASGKFDFPKLQEPYFSIVDMAARHIGNVETEIGLGHWPNLYCGVAVLLFLPLYMAAKKISWKEKAVYGLLVLFFFASFSVNVLNFVWHGFHFPNSLPCRQSYIYIFLVLVMCCKAYLHLSDTPWRHVVLAFWGAVGFVVLAEKLVDQEHFHFVVFYVAILFLALYLGAVWMYQKGGKKSRIVLFALALVSIEAAVNTSVTSVATTSRTAYTNDNASVNKLMELVLPAQTFFRVEKVTRKTKNDGAWMNFPSVSLFSSTANADLTKLFKRLGCESSTNAYSITGSTPLVDMLLSVKYGIYSEDPEDTGIREFVAREGDTSLYENLYTLPLGMMIPEKFLDQWEQELGNPVDVQNALVRSVGADPVLNMVMDVSVSGQNLTFRPEESGEYYAYVGQKKVEKVTVSTWKGTKNYNNVDRGYLLDLGYCVAEEEVTLTTEGTVDGIWADVYRFSDTGLIQAYEKLSKNPWELTSWQETQLEGTIFTPNGGIMMMTIPFDEGWTVLVDGERQDAEKILDAFIGVELEGGEHEISMTYQPKGLTEGRWISTGCLVALVLVETAGWLWRKRKRQWELDEEEEDEWELEPEESSEDGESNHAEEICMWETGGEEEEPADVRDNRNERNEEENGTDRTVWSENTEQGERIE